MSDLVSGIIGAAVGFFANYSIERFRRRGVINDVRRKAYATWFASEALMSERLKSVCERLSGFPRDIERHMALTAEMSALAADLKTLVTSMNEAFLAEKKLDS
jgi:hypothetical protein